MKVRSRKRVEAAFSLVELLVVVAIVAVLAALVLCGVSNAKAQSQSAACKNNLHQVGIALKIDVSDSVRYPSIASVVDGELETWADRLYPNTRSAWTNPVCQCPAYVTQHGLIKTTEPLRRGEIFTSYAYNEWGLVDTARGRRLGLGFARGSTISESHLAAPSDMIAIADSRTFRNSNTAQGLIEPLHGLMQMQPFFDYHDETKPLHGRGYNILFADGHVALVKRRHYLYPSMAAHNWNGDNQPHPEMWRPTSGWAVRN